MLVSPGAAVADSVAAQAAAIQRALGSFIESEGGDEASLRAETVFLRDPEADLEAVRRARADVLAERAPGAGRDAGHDAAPGSRPWPVRLEIGQPPLEAGARLVVAAHAVFQRASGERVWSVSGASRCDCAECERATAVCREAGPERHLTASALYGLGDDAYGEACDLFEHAARLLDRAGMDFRDVVRTWIHLRDIDRDYAALNRARRDFFAAHGVDPPPASTGIGGAPVAPSHALALGLLAVRSDEGVQREPMHAPTLNEAPEYGADFARGLVVHDANGGVMHLSGTASIDEAGRTAHPGDFDAQAERMLLNLASLLEGQGASFRDVVSAVTYLKDPLDAERLRAKLAEAGFTGFPHALVEAPICRSDLLCETEAVAIPRAGTDRVDRSNEARGGRTGRRTEG